MYVPDALTMFIMKFDYPTSTYTNDYDFVISKFTRGGLNLNEVFI